MEKSRKFYATGKSPRAASRHAHPGLRNLQSHLPFRAFVRNSGQLTLGLTASLTTGMCPGHGDTHCAVQRNAHKMLVIFGRLRTYRSFRCVRNCKLFVTTSAMTVPIKIQQGIRISASFSRPVHLRGYRGLVPAAPRQTPQRRNQDRKNLPRSVRPVLA